MILDQLNQIIDNDIAMIYGETGAGKSKTVKQIALESAQAGKKVKFIDTERNLSKADIAEISKSGKYIYNPTWDGLEKEIANIGKFDLLVVDSIGMPALKHYAGMKLNQKGQAMLDMIGVLGKIKDWCYNNNSIALVTNQNQSAMAAAGKQDYILRPFGDKAQYVVKEIWRMSLVESKPDRTLSTLSAYRSRDLGRFTVIANVIITDKGTKIDLKYQSKEVGISPDVFESLSNQIVSAASMTELAHIGAKIQGLTNEMSTNQRDILRQAYAARKQAIEKEVNMTSLDDMVSDPGLEAEIEWAQQEGLL